MNKRKKKKWIWIILVIIALGSCGSLVNKDKGGQQESQATEADTIIESEKSVVIETETQEAEEETETSSMDASFVEYLQTEIVVNNIPDYTGEPYVSVNNGQPYFTEEEKSVTEEFELYSELDSLERCGTAYANISKATLPTEERGEIGSVRPSGWHTVKYNDLIDGNYLYNRCHLIAYQLAGENANVLNLITGTRYLNVVGMLQYENTVCSYVEETGNHVLYRVTPVFEGDNLVASGVLMEGWSVEDAGAGICFNVFCFNVQPGIVIDYANGDSHEEEENFESEVTVVETQEVQPEEPSEPQYDLVINKNTKKFHLSYCSSVNQMKEKNKKEYHGTIQEVIDMGYSPCKNCLSGY